MVLGFTGDLFLGRSVPAGLFEQFSRDLGPDVRLVTNFEGTLYRKHDDLRPHRQKILLDSPAVTFDAVKQLPIALLCTGNNHIGDYGDEIAQFTLSHAAKDFPVFGAGRAAEPFHRYNFSEGDITIGFANYATRDCTPIFTSSTVIGPRPLIISRAAEDLAILKQQASLAVAIVHWGLEDFHHPRPAQLRLGRKLIDLGFDLVIGHHPHTAQGYEIHKGRCIFYSLGNFYFPDHEVLVDGGRHSVKWMRRRSWGLVPLFDVTPDKIALREVKIISLARNKAPRVSSSAYLQSKFQRISRDLAKKPYWRAYQKWRRQEELTTRFEEFLNNEQKVKSVVRKFRKLLSLKQAA